MIHATNMMPNRSLDIAIACMYCTSYSFIVWGSAIADSSNSGEDSYCCHPWSVSVSASYGKSLDPTVSSEQK